MRAGISGLMGLSAILIGTRKFSGMFESGFRSTVSLFLSSRHPKQWCSKERGQEPKLRAGTYRRRKSLIPSQLSRALRRNWGPRQTSSLESSTTNAARIQHWCNCIKMHSNAPVSNGCQVAQLAVVLALFTTSPCVSSIQVHRYFACQGMKTAREITRKKEGGELSARRHAV